MTEDRVLTTTEAARQLGITVHHLAQWRHEGRGPSYIRDGRFIRYRQSAVNRWLNAREVHPAKAGVERLL